ncbi:MAG: ABC transporter ATP-binding protein/permease [Acetatifactor sp.]|nr:ABC transporter ATP-binding protein/permease [Acetatifactor sp.]
MEDGLPKIWRDIEKELSDQGFITVGQFAACISAFGCLQAITEALISMVADEKSKADFVGDFYDFFDNATEGDKPFNKFQNEIAARNVCFAYPVNNKEVLHDVSFTIKKGERVVIVGENGSGKTTLSKIIAGVYEPCSGEVAYDGENAKEFERTGFYRQFSVISQDFVGYQLTMRENIGMSTPNQMHNDEKLLQSAKAADIEQIVRRVGELDTQLGREFDGVELSGGEWQKISIARGLNKDADIIILDEPTSALDPLVEYDILKKFVDLTEGKTSVIISHRVGLCRFADRIIVMQDGRVAGNGTHEELLGSNAEYKRIWNEQAKWYAE